MKDGPETSGQLLWFLSLDLKKCFPSLPWWGLFGVLTRLGVADCTARFAQLLSATSSSVSVWLSRRFRMVYMAWPGLSSQPTLTL